jgi:hypothetical protein
VPPVVPPPIPPVVESPPVPPVIGSPPLAPVPPLATAPPVAFDPPEEVAPVPPVAFEPPDEVAPVPPLPNDAPAAPPLSEPEDPGLGGLLDVPQAVNPMKRTNATADSPRFRTKVGYSRRATN